MQTETLKTEVLIAMAAAAVAEETGQDVKTLRVVSFREVQPSPLRQYLAERGIEWHRFELNK